MCVWLVGYFSNFLFLLFGFSLFVLILCFYFFFHFLFLLLRESEVVSAVFRKEQSNEEAHRSSIELVYDCSFCFSLVERKLSSKTCFFVDKLSIFCSLCVQENSSLGKKKAKREQRMKTVSCDFKDFLIFREIKKGKHHRGTKRIFFTKIKSNKKRRRRNIERRRE